MIDDGCREQSAPFVRVEMEFVDLERNYTEVDST